MVMYRLLRRINPLSDITDEAMGYIIASTATLPITVDSAVVTRN